MTASCKTVRHLKLSNALEGDDRLAVDAATDVDQLAKVLDRRVQVFDFVE